MSDATVFAVRALTVLPILVGFHTTRTAGLVGYLKWMLLRRIWPFILEWDRLACRQEIRRQSLGRYQPV